MQSFLKKHRWCILAAGAAVQILTGVPAAWGVFQQSVCEVYRLEPEQAALAVSILLGAFGAGCIPGGFLQDKKGPRAAGLLGAMMLSVGFCAAGLAVPAGAPWALYAAFSVPAGAGCALLYPAVMSCAQQWYSERKGLATGVIGGAVGASGAVLTALGRGLMTAWGLRAAFCALGALMLAVCGGACVFLTAPPPTAAAHSRPQKTFTVPQMLAAPQYWLLSAAAGLAAPSVLLFSPRIVELAAERGLPERAGLLCIVLGSVFAAAGRLLMPWLSDHIGRRKADLLAFGALAGLSLWLMGARGWQLIAAYGLLTFCYAGQAAVLPCAVTDLFGAAGTGVHYGFVALGMSAGSVGFPLLARALDMGAARHWMAVGAACAGFVCLLLLRPTHGVRL